MQAVALTLAALAVVGVISIHTGRAAELARWLADATPEALRALTKWL